MSLRHRLSSLEKRSFPILEKRLREKDFMRKWLDWLANWPVEFTYQVCAGTSGEARPADSDELEQLRTECRVLRQRVLDGELSTLDDIVKHLPDRCLQGRVTFAGWLRNCATENSNSAFASGKRGGGQSCSSAELLKKVVEENLLRRRLGT